ncbi:hypothetical protein QR90_06840 [Deinococcus radiopugnans]|uniref:Uncharacterized protein n=1 Tax=Deinococcus radiopugnans TaxID=57497 RepID=A0A0A7KI62_9DEIO|nr:hypothetical protein [Deinococcus radiopugnans]AIZ44884.1 hypothetical protein QR90_06840 [Deinococcus radiopugnans]QLG10980.1 hypothetical protein HLB42_09505 [Deinococcus sp. D7000]
MMLALSLALLAAPPAPPGCHLQVIPDYTLVVAYRAVLRLSPECGFSETLRVRKSSTTSTRRNGAPYQPIRPEAGAWELGRLKSTVPDRQLWTSWSWAWQWYDAEAWNPRTKTSGTWRAAEVLYARP